MVEVRCPALIRVVVAVEVGNKPVPVFGRGKMINAVAESSFTEQSCGEDARFACGSVILVFSGELNAKATAGPGGREFGDFAEVGSGFFAPAKKLSST